MHLSFVPEEDTDWEFREALRREETDVEEVLLEKEEEEVSGYGKLFCGILGREILIGRARILIWRREFYGGEEGKWRIAGTRGEQVFSRDENF